MASCQWTLTTGNGNWADGTKWTCGTPPVDGDTAVFPDIGTNVLRAITIQSTLNTFPDVLNFQTTTGVWDVNQSGSYDINLTHDVTINMNLGANAFWDGGVRSIFQGAGRYIYKRGGGRYRVYQGGTNYSTTRGFVVSEGGVYGVGDFYPTSAADENGGYENGRWLTFGDAVGGAAAALLWNGGLDTALTCTTPLRLRVNNSTFRCDNSTAIGSMTLQGPIWFDFLDANAAHTVSCVSGTITWSGRLQGAGSFTKTGTYQLNITSAAGDSTFTGTFGVTQGTLAIGASNALQCATLNYTGATGTFSYTAGATIGGLSGERNIALGAAINFGPATTPAGVTLVNATYTGSFSGAGKISKYGAHTQAFVGGVNTHTGGIDIYGGRVRGSDSTSALGSSSGAITVYTGGALEVTGISTVNKTSAALTLGAGAGNVALYGSGGGGLSPANIVLATDTVISANQFTITSAGDVSDAGAGRKLTFTGAGYLVWDVPISSSYSGGTVLDSPDLRVSRSIVSAGLSSIFGTGTIELYKNLTYVGGGVAGTFFRAITCPAGGSPEFKTLGGGELTISGALTVNASTLRFAGGGANIRVTSALTMASGALNFDGGDTTYFSSNVSGTVAINFISGALLLGGTLTNTGGINMTAANVLGAVTPGGTVTYLPTTGNLTISAGTIIDKFRARIVTAAGVGGTITALLEDQTVGGGETTLTVGSGHTLTVQPNTAYTGATGNNTYSGATSISGTCNAVLSSGSINPAIGNGKVFGDSPVTVENNGHIRTKASFATGQMRYKSLKFKAGSKLSIGAIA